MSATTLHEYRQALDIHHGRHKGRPNFYALIMAAMLGADTENAMRLAGVFPEVREELQVRYDTPGGTLPSELPVPVPLRPETL